MEEGLVVAMYTESPISELIADPMTTGDSGSGLLVCEEDDSDGSSTPVEVPIDLGQLVGRCMGNLQIVDRALAKFEVCFDKDLAELEQCLERQEVDEVRRLAHRLKGSAASVAAGGLARCSKRLEELARSQQLNEVPPCVGRLRREWSRFLSFRARHDESRAATSLDQDGGENRFM